MDRRTFLKGSLVVALTPSILKSLPASEKTPPAHFAVVDFPPHTLVDVNYYEVQILQWDRPVETHRVHGNDSITFTAYQHSGPIQIRTRKVDSYNIKSDWIKSDGQIYPAGADLTVTWKETAFRKGVITKS